jgi:hypothetical protein
MISSEDCYAIWAPDASVWAQWAKPVMFASAPGLVTDIPLSVATLSGRELPDGRGSTAVILDLPGEESVSVGLAFAERGFQPVPLFNGTDGPNPVVKTADLLSALGAGAEVLKAMPIGVDARPVFLLDSNRRDSMGAVSSGYYDNRWIVLPQDLPSASYLLAAGVKEVLLVLRDAEWPSEDLAHVLLRWQERNIGIRFIDLAKNESAKALIVIAPSLFRRAWYAAVALSGLRRCNVGGFGSVVPDQTAGSGFYG